MRAVLLSIGVIAAGSLLSGSATAQYVPYPTGEGFYYDMGFVQQDPFQPYGNGYGAQVNGGNGNLMGNVGWANQDLQMFPNDGRQYQNQLYGSQPRYFYPKNVLRPDPMRQTQYMQQFPYVQQLQPMQQPQYGPQPQYMAQPRIAPHLNFAQQPFYNMPIPTIQSFNVR
ncbi:MAG: hypothetical protein P4L85_00935 [Paludisphaera borealis]|uniref:hypothetical protein n=1 Tax=Paludisphaera borealis TaxID=1387353 RepID=UPI00283F830C|nr:hypothetical protein [Paludisphaera borealis]MDR3617885.1 hypothetical protein [Paludisphaera borealis]